MRLIYDNSRLRKQNNIISHYSLLIIYSRWSLELLPLSVRMRQLRSTFFSLSLWRGLGRGCWRGLGRGFPLRGRERLQKRKRPHKNMPVAFYFFKLTRIVSCCLGTLMRTFYPAFSACACPSLDDEQGNSSYIRVV